MAKFSDVSHVWFQAMPWVLVVAGVLGMAEFAQMMETLDHDS